MTVCKSYSDKKCRHDMSSDKDKALFLKYLGLIMWNQLATKTVEYHNRQMS